MQKPETLAQLICRTVLEFEQRQAALQQQADLEGPSVCSNYIVANQTLSKNKSKGKRPNRKKKTA